MQLGDVPAVMAIERVAFSTPWSARSYYYELANNERSHYFVLHRREPIPYDATGLLARLRLILRRQRQPESDIVGHGGFWVSGQRAHISTLAIAPGWRGRGLGLMLLLHMLDRAVDLGMEMVSLEVRVSNYTAQNLYRKCGFRRAGLHKGYYHDDGEDALLMSTPLLRRPAYQLRLARLHEELQYRLAHQPKGGEGSS